MLRIRLGCAHRLRKVRRAKSCCHVAPPPPDIDLHAQNIRNRFPVAAARDAAATSTHLSSDFYHTAMILLEVCLFCVPYEYCCFKRADAHRLQPHNYIIETTLAEKALK